MPAKQIVLVTGGTGFLGSHIISQLLAQDKYTIRAVARSDSKLRAIFPDAPKDKLEIVELPTLTSDFSDALKGVEAVVHSASPAYLKGENGKEIFEGAYQGTIHILEQAIAAGVKKIVATGTIASLFDGDFKNAFGTKTITGKDFSPVTADQIDINDPNTMGTYVAAKTVADKKVWELAHQHLDVDITVVLPPVIFGPFVPNFPVTSRSGLGTNDYIYSLIADSAYPQLPIGYLIDVRDATRAHIAALSAPPVPGKDKRIIVSSSTFTWRGITDLIRKKRPELKERLPKEGLEQGYPQTDAPLDLEFSKEVLGMKEYIGWEETVLEALDASLVLERK
ncbi:hypothetical protein VKT23_010329 [Stygiomarasmius scandens]|uniref:NAD-dependent epimerase/dehydratase domain-containing protein n=1 Tax=Marasmiellus scandens TaxID=2682957 RepID=A0ABR1JGJ3_9AGAR